MFKTRFNNLLSIAVISYLITACGSSSNQNNSSTVGKVVDDYIAGAMVCADVNNNGLADDGVENCVETDSQGNFRFSTIRSESLVMSGGIDIGTGQPFRGTLSAPPGSTVVNPLTTLIHSVQNEGNITSEKAQEIVKNQLGLNNTNVDLTTFDPLSELQFGEDTATKEVAQQVLAQQTTVQVVLSVTATTISATSENIEEREVSVEASNQMARLILTPTDNNPTKISSRETIKTIIEETAQETFSGNTEEDTDALASIEAVQDVVAQQIQVVAQTVSTNIQSVQVNNSEQSSLDIIEESNAAILLVTDTQSEDSVTNIIEEAVTTGETQTLANVNINSEIDNSQDNLIERPEIVEQIKEDIEIKVTGGEGGTL